MKIMDEDRQVNSQTHGINGFGIQRQWSCSCSATMTDGLLDCTDGCGVHITGNTGATLNLLCACMLVACACRAEQTNTAEIHH